jgi:hypothetical protein
MELQQQRLWTPALVAWVARGEFVIADRGWTLVVSRRAEGEDWSATPEDRYSSLTAEELVQVLEFDLCAALGL